MSNSSTMTLGRLASATGLARASLLHYEGLGLLRPMARSAAGYRLYGQSEIERLAKIRRLRSAGLTLKAIRELLANSNDGARPAQILEQRLIEVSTEVERLRAQQKQLATLLASLEFRRGRSATKTSWVAMLRRAGFTEQEMHEWHRSFERDSPREHAAFLRSLGIASAEVAQIRRWSRRDSQRV